MRIFRLYKKYDYSDITEDVCILLVHDEVQARTVLNAMRSEDIDYHRGSTNYEFYIQEIHTERSGENN